MGYRTRYLNTPVFKERLTEMGKLGLKSIMYAGEGEPLLHKDIAEITKHTKESGIDVSFTTNGVFLRPKLAEQLLPHTTWIKVSINAGTADTYSGIHRTKREDFDKVVSNLEEAAHIRKRQGSNCTLGMQMLLLPENVHEVTVLAELAKKIGMDYLVIKPYSQHIQGISHQYEDIRYDAYYHLDQELQKFNDEHFHVVFRRNTMKKWDEGKHAYGRCFSLPFWSYIDAGGNVWGCSIYLEDPRFSYGNIYTQSFEEIWNDVKRLHSLHWVENELDVSECRLNCRMDNVNQYLWNLKHPNDHVNFI